MKLKPRIVIERRWYPVIMIVPGAYRITNGNGRNVGYILRLGLEAWTGRMAVSGILVTCNSLSAEGIYQDLVTAVLQERTRQTRRRSWLRFQKMKYDASKFLMRPLEKIRKHLGLGEARFADLLAHGWDDPRFAGKAWAKQPVLDPVKQRKRERQAFWSGRSVSEVVEDAKLIR